MPRDESGCQSITQTTVSTSETTAANEPQNDQTPPESDECCDGIGGSRCLSKEASALGSVGDADSYFRDNIFDWYECGKWKRLFGQWCFDCAYYLFCSSFSMAKDDCACDASEPRGPGFLQSYREDRENFFQVVGEEDGIGKETAQMQRLAEEASQLAEAGQQQGQDTTLFRDEQQATCAEDASCAEDQDPPAFTGKRLCGTWSRVPLSPEEVGMGDCIRCFDENGELYPFLKKCFLEIQQENRIKLLRRLYREYGYSEWPSLSDKPPVTTLHEHDDDPLDDLEDDWFEKHATHDTTNRWYYPLPLVLREVDEMDVDIQT
ncbi:hypothetical protein BJ508DRAFT_138741 [Ascobolus immersus RN42]|uniref:Uncharacterized protein n=1 Tax=Ascobolus immersus RN42 TaxID=1160509 RepID=A0A3N4ID31_ASCIM|nr:hypothetical protein BJ508DRAFT_138741 [Ascobolus immersus RN42]